MDLTFSGSDLEPIDDFEKSVEEVIANKCFKTCKFILQSKKPKSVFQTNLSSSDDSFEDLEFMPCVVSKHRRANTGNSLGTSTHT